MVLYRLISVFMGFYTTDIILKSANGMAMKFGITIQCYQQRNTLKIQRSNIQNV